MNGTTISHYFELESPDQSDTSQFMGPRLLAVAFHFLVRVLTLCWKQILVALRCFTESAPRPIESIIRYVRVSVVPDVPFPPPPPLGNFQSNKNHYKMWRSYSLWFSPIFSPQFPPGFSPKIFIPNVFPPSYLPTFTPIFLPQDSLP